MRELKTRVAANTAAYTLLRMLSYIPPMVLLPIYTHAMPPSEYGIVAIANAFAALLAPFMGLKLSSAVPRFYFENQNQHLREYVSSILLTVVGLGIVTSGVIGIAGDSLTTLLFPKANIPFFPYFAIAIVTLLIREISLVAERLLMTEERGGALLQRHLFGSPIAIGLGFWFVIGNDWGAAGALSATACTNAIMAALSIWMIRKHLVWTWRAEWVWPSLRYAVPLIPFAFGSYLFLFSDRVILEKFLPLAAVGLYNIADRLASALKDIIHAVNNALQPNYMRLATQKGPTTASARFADIVVLCMTLFSMLFLLMSLYCEEVIILITPKSYHAAYPVIPILLCAYLLRGLYCFAVQPLLFAKQTRVLPIITLIAGVANVGLNLLIIPIWGIYGAAWATVISFGLTVLAAYRISLHFNPIRFDWLRLLAVTGPVLAAAAMMYGLRESPYLWRWCAKLLITTAYVIYIWIMNPANLRTHLRDLCHHAQHRTNKGAEKQNLSLDKR